LLQRKSEQEFKSNLIKNDIYKILAIKELERSVGMKVFDTNLGDNKDKTIKIDKNLWENFKKSWRVTTKKIPTTYGELQLEIMKRYPKTLVSIKHVGRNKKKEKRDKYEYTIELDENLLKFHKDIYLLRNPYLNGVDNIILDDQNNNDCGSSCELSLQSNRMMIMNRKINDTDSENSCGLTDDDFDYNDDIIPSK